jgi:hypothetical protein
LFVAKTGWNEAIPPRPPSFFEEYIRYFVVCRIRLPF